MATSVQKSSDMSVRESELDGEEELDYETENEDNGGYGADKSSNHALNLRFCVGFNYKMVGGVVNLVNDDRKWIFYTAGNTGVVYEFNKGHHPQSMSPDYNPQFLLQGHCNEISCVAYCLEHDILVTADKGPSSLMVIWDVKAKLPRHTIFDPHPHGVESLDITEDGTTIVTLSREIRDGRKHEPQTVKVWRYNQNNGGYYEEFISARSDRVISRNTGSWDYQKYININHFRIKKDRDQYVFFEFVTTGEEKVYFWNLNPTKEFGIEGYQPPSNTIMRPEKKENDSILNDKKGDAKKKGTNNGNSKKNGKEKEQDKRNHAHSRTFTQSVFIPNCEQAVTGTDYGLLVIWNVSQLFENLSDRHIREETKSISLLNWSGKNNNEKIGISVLLSRVDFLIVGATNGQVQFYDHKFRLVSWFESDIPAEVTSISISFDRNFDPIKNREETKKEEYFDYPDFIVVYKNARILNIKAAMFKESGFKETEYPDKKKGRDLLVDDPNQLFEEKNNSKYREVILESISGRINCISARPEASQVAICCDNGIVYEFDTGSFYLRAEGIKPYPASPGERPTCLSYSPNGEHLIVCTNQRNVHCYKIKKKEWQKNTLTISQKKENYKGVKIAFADTSDWFAVMDDKACVSIFKLEKGYSDGQDGDWAFNGAIESHIKAVNDLCFIEKFENNMAEPVLYSIGEDKHLVQYDLKSFHMRNIQDHCTTTQIEHEVVPKACLWYPVNRTKEPILLVATEDYKLKLWDVKGESKQCLATYLGPTYEGPIEKLLYLKRKEEDSFKYVAYCTAEKVAGVIKLPLDGNPNKTMGMTAHPGRISAMTASSDGKFVFTSGADDIGVMNIWLVNYAAIDEQEKLAQVEGGPLDIYPSLLEGGKDGQLYRDLNDFFYFAQIDSKKDNPTKAKKLDRRIPYDSVPNMMRALGYYPTNQEALNMQNEVLYSKRHQSDQLEKTLGLETFVKLFVNHRPVYGLTSNLIKQKLDVLKGDGKYTKEDLIRDLTTRGDKFTHETLKKCLNILAGDGEPLEILQDEITSKYLIEEILGMEEADAEDDIQEEMPNTSQY